MRCWPCRKYKTCVYLFYYEKVAGGMAALTGVPSSTVRSHLVQAR
ncbi:MAG: hypothetical protein ACLSVD_09010 [Eggerthellaceae bacterium]